MIRHATHNDLEAVVTLGTLKRNRHATWQPLFHKPAPDAERHHHVHLASLIGKSHVVFLVSEDEGHRLEGYVLGTLSGGSPVYARGGTVMHVDDFGVEPEAAWGSVGKALLEEAMKEAKKRGAAMVNVVCSPKEEGKQRLLDGLGLGCASEWRVKEL